MKIVVMNFSGNVGKSTIAKNLLRPRLGDAQIFEVESLNVGSSADDPSVIKLRGKKYNEVVENMMMLDSAIVDVGASNVEEFLKQMQQYAGSHEEFDYFVIPTVKEKKQQADTVNTLRALKAIGVPKSKVRVIFNKVETDESVEEEFSAIFALAELEKSFVLRPDAVIYANEIYERIKGKSIDSILNDPVDYRAKMRETSDEEEKAECIRMVSLKRLAITANANLDAVHKTLFKG